MKYSFIRPRRKTVLTPEFKLLLTFFSITLFMLFTTYGFTLYRDYKFIQKRANIVETRANLDISISNYKKEIVYLRDEIDLSQKIYKHNKVLKESITNLFDLIPTRITLSEAVLLEKGLVLYGITPNKDIYNFMLEAPLRSIFDTTYTSFYPSDNGWIHFVSTNYMEIDETKVQKDENNEEK